MHPELAVGLTGDECGGQDQGVGEGSDHGGAGLRLDPRTASGRRVRCLPNVPLSDDAACGPKNCELFLNELAERYETPDFIGVDPISIPHRYTNAADVEIAAFFAAIFAWGQRPTILAKSSEFLAHMGASPHEFIVEHGPDDRRAFDGFVHRTFQPTDAHYLLDRLQRHYREHESLESLFTAGRPLGAETVRPALERFHESVFDLADAPARTRKHVATPARASGCKRLNMFLRWMVRPAAKGVDFGLWRDIHPRQLIVPIDLHVRRVATEWGLLSRKQNDWQAAEELTAALRAFDAADPVRYDFALFGWGVDRAARDSRP